MNNTKFISRDDARKLGLKRYSTLKPCEKGHICERYVASNVCIKCHAIVQSNFRKSHRAQMNAYRITEDKYKNRAQRAVHRAVKKGLLKKLPCERCGATIGVHAHHEDYSRQLDVMWLCVQHHKERHREIEGKSA